MVIKFTKPLLIAIGVIFIGAAGLAGYTLVSGKGLLLSQIEKNLGVSAEASSVEIGLPFSLVVKDLKVGENISCARLVVTPSLLCFLMRGDLFQNSIVLEKPVVRITRNAGQTIDFGFPLLAKKEVKAPEVKAPSENTGGPTPAGEQHFKRKNLYAQDIKIIDGRVEVTDRGNEGAGPFVGHVVDLKIHARRVSLAQATRMRFDVEGRLTDYNGATAARLKASGWVDPFAKDMDAQVSLTDVDLTAFKAYTLKFLKRELATGQAQLTAVLKSDKNDLTGDGHIALKGVAFKQETSAEIGSSAGQADQTQAALQDFGTSAFNLVLAAYGEVAFDFTFETKMDSPRLDKLKVKKLKGKFFQNKQMGQDFKQIGKRFKEMFK